AAQPCWNSSAGRGLRRAYRSSVMGRSQAAMVTSTLSLRSNCTQEIRLSDSFTRRTISRLSPCITGTSSVPTTVMSSSLSRASSSCPTAKGISSSGMSRAGEPSGRFPMIMAGPRPPNRSYRRKTPWQLPSGAGSRPAPRLPGQSPGSMASTSKSGPAGVALRRRRNDMPPWYVPGRGDGSSAAAGRTGRTDVRVTGGTAARGPARLLLGGGRRDDRDGAHGVQQHRLGDGSHHAGGCQQPPPVASDDDQAGSPRGVHQVAGGVAGQGEDLDGHVGVPFAVGGEETLGEDAVLVLDGTLVDLRRGHLTRQHPGLQGPRVGGDDRQPGTAQGRLREGEAERGLVRTVHVEPDHDPGAGRGRCLVAVLLAG